ncbi:MAG: hypothetical protein AAGB48_07815 [Planctomycetota bacterium]
MEGFSTWGSVDSKPEADGCGLVPFASIAGDLVLMAMDQPSEVETLGMIAMGLIPGGKLLAKLGPTIAKVGVEAWGYAKEYAMQGKSLLSRGENSGTVDDLQGL